jgi:hypothetical protein
VDEHVLPQPGDLVFDVQFLTFQFRNLEVVDGGVGECFCNFLFKRLVPFLKFRKLRFNRHVACLLADGQIRSSYTLTIGLEDTPLLPVRKSPTAHYGGLVGDWPKRDNHSSLRCSQLHDPLACRPKNAPCRLGATRVAMTQDEESELRAELARLQQEHRDLDVAIVALQDSPGSDLIQVQRLKKRKLLLRDRITFIEDQLTPDIIA